LSEEEKGEWNKKAEKVNQEAVEKASEE